MERILKTQIATTYQISSFDQEEIQRGQMILQNNKLFSTPFPWSLLAASAVGDFFLCAPRYIQVYRSTTRDDIHLHASSLEVAIYFVFSFISSMTMTG